MNEQKYSTQIVKIIDNSNPEVIMFQFALDKQLITISHIKNGNFDYEQLQPGKTYVVTTSKNWEIGVWKWTMACPIDLTKMIV